MREEIAYARKFEPGKEKNDVFSPCTNNSCMQEDLGQEKERYEMFSLCTDNSRMQEDLGWPIKDLPAQPDLDLRASRSSQHKRKTT
jgi:hypothetical protein